MAETLGVVPNEELFIVYNAKSGLIWNENYYGQALVPIHLPPSYLMPLQVTRSPRPSPSVQAVKYWRQEWPGNEATHTWRNLDVLLLFAGSMCS